MSRLVLSPSVPYVVAQRLRSLLHGFPSAAIGGVRWSTLMRRYEECHCLPLDLAALGHASPLGAATALLWDVLRLVDAEDPNNPTVALDDREVLAPHAPSFAAWPSLYEAVCTLVEEAEAEQNRCKEEQDAIPGVPLSRLRSLLRANWHRHFGEETMSYLTEEGCSVRLDSMEDFVEALLMWREERSIWRSATCARPTALDEALRPELDLAVLGPWGELHVCRKRAEAPCAGAAVFPPRNLLRRLSTVQCAAKALEAQAASPASTAVPSLGEGSGSRTPEQDSLDTEHSSARGERPEEEPEESLEEANPADGPWVGRAKTAPLGLGDRAQIPSGTVRQGRVLFERKNTLPGFFAQAA